MARTSRTAGAAAAASASGSGAAVDALDNLDLDDMFADGNDDLFDGLDIDLGNMDDITTSNADAHNDNGLKSKGPKTGNFASTAASPGRTLASFAADQEIAAAAAAATSADANDNKRRKTRRKTRSPVFFDYDDDDYVEETSKKRKRPTSKTASSKKKGKKTASSSSAAAAVAGPSTLLAAPPKSASKKSSTAKSSHSMLPPVARAAVSTTTSSSTGGGVAAAGRFGQHSKRPGSLVLPKSKKGILPTQQRLDHHAFNKGGRSSAAEMPLGQLRIAPAGPGAAAGTAATTTHASHPGLAKSTFCGLLPSDKIFYPFMLELPAEPSIKNRKIFPHLDKLLSAWGTHMNAGSSSSGGGGSGGKQAPIANVPRASETEAIFQLLTHLSKDEKSAQSSVLEKNDTVGAAVTLLRRQVAAMDKPSLTQDLLAVAQLLKRQHDFLKQNAINMEVWCKDNFSEPDHVAVYLPDRFKRRKSVDSATGASVSSLPGSVLSSMTSTTIQVRLYCSAFKEPKLAPITAELPSYMIGDSKTAVADMSSKKDVKRSKKRKPTGADSPKSTATPPVPARPPTYFEMAPADRRRQIMLLIETTARALDTSSTPPLPGTPAATGSAAAAASTVDNAVSGELAHAMTTAGMWKWIGKSGFFVPLSRTESQKRLRSQVMPSVHRAMQQQSGETRRWRQEESYVSRSDDLHNNLLALLAAESHDDEDDDESDLPDEDLTDYGGNGRNRDVDLSRVATPERLALHLAAATLIEPGDLTTVKNEPHAAKGVEKEHHALNGSGPVHAPLSQSSDHHKTEAVAASRDDLVPVIYRMIADVADLTERNNARLSQMDMASRQIGMGDAEVKQQAESEAALITKCQSLMRKTREHSKTKAGKMTNEKDGLALPW